MLLTPRLSLVDIARIVVTIHSRDEHCVFSSVRLYQLYIFRAGRTKSAYEYFDASTSGELSSVSVELLGEACPHLGDPLGGGSDVGRDRSPHGVNGPVDRAWDAPVRLASGVYL